MFKKFISLFIVLGFFTSLVAAQTPAPIAKKGTVVATIKLVIGSVKVQLSGEKTKLVAKESMLLSVGDSIETNGKSYAVLIMANGAQIKINQKTKFTIEDALNNEELGSRVKISVGQIWAKIISGKQFYVKTPTAVCSIRGTELDVKVDNSGLSEVLVYEGVVEVRNDYGVVQVNKEEKTVTKPEAAPQAPAVVDMITVEKWQDAVIPKEEEKKEEKKVEKKKEEPKKEETKEVKKEETEKQEIPQEVVPEPMQPVVPEASPSVPE